MALHEGMGVAPTTPPHLELPRVLHHPTTHPYVDRLHGRACHRVNHTRSRDAQALLYDPDWVAEYSAAWDVVHVHFGFERQDPDRLAAVLEAHRRAGTRIAWTAHTLPPEGVEDPRHQLLAEHADAVLTLTTGAAEEVRDRYGRFARVVPHGPLVAERTANRIRRHRRIQPRMDGGWTRLLLLAGDLGPELDWRTVVHAAAEGDLPGLLDVSAEADHVEQVRGVAEGSSRIVVSVEDPPSPGRLTARMAAADVLLLPAVAGTHSALLEVALDLGVPVVTGDVGHLAEQGATAAVPVVDGRLDRDRLGPAVIRALDARHRPVPWVERERALWAFLTCHEQLYRRLAQRRMVTLPRPRASIDLTDGQVVVAATSRVRRTAGLPAGRPG